MIIPNRERAEKKLSQIGYYRLSGFWYPCRQFKVDRNGDDVIHPATGEQIRDDCFQENINFNDIYGGPQKTNNVLSSKSFLKKI